MSDVNSTVLFEISWEVCRKVGGIYTVLRSKAPTMVERWGDAYCLIGAYHEPTAGMEFEPLPPGEIMANTLEALRHRGIECRFGRWLITGYPKVVLVDLAAGYARLDETKQRLWNEHQIPTPPHDDETNDAAAFAFLVHEVLTEHARQHPDRRVIAHFHEWMASAALPLVARFGRVPRGPAPIATVFTTHATLLGRYLCTTWPDFYERLSSINPDLESGNRNIYHRYCLERAAANAADVFTTVSEVTATEADYLLKRRADLVLPNGLRLEKFAALHEFQNLHSTYKERIHEFVRGHFFGSYAFDLQNTLYMFFAGRYEYRNKGIDLFIEALHRLNGHLKDVGSDKTVVAFLITPAATTNVNVEVLNNHFLLDELHKTCDDITEDLRRRMFDIAATGEIPEPHSLLTEHQVIQLKRMLFARRRSALPPIVTHDMADSDNDAILTHLRHRRLFNDRLDRVKVVYHPQFLSSTNPLFGLEYDEFVRGCHLGVFPSYYEPWGYTPAECIVLGVPSVTTNLSGFGTFITGEVPDHNRRGVYVIDRRRKGAGRALDDLSQIMIEFCALNRRDRIALRNRTEQLSDLLDWSELGQAYHRAHELALNRAYPASVPNPQ
ncbi:MAG: glycogen synthase [bacterium]|nr:glycogen synthase [bacterium]